MAELIQLVPATRFESSGAGDKYEQPLASALDVSQYSSVTVIVSVLYASLASDTDVYLQTAMKNGENQYVNLSKLCTIASSGQDYPLCAIVQYRGPGKNNDSDTAFPCPARFIRLVTEGVGASDYIMFEAKVLLR